MTRVVVFIGPVAAGLNPSRSEFLDAEDITGVMVRTNDELREALEQQAKIDGFVVADKWGRFHAEYALRILTQAGHTVPCLMHAFSANNPSGDPWQEVAASRYPNATFVLHDERWPKDALRKFFADLRSE